MHLLSIGYARVDLTPAESVALCGYGDDTQRISEGMLDPVTGTCIAISDKNNETDCNSQTIRFFGKWNASDIHPE